RLGGLDKMYRLHKWLGIGGLTMSVLHWALCKSPRYLIDLGWLERPARRPRPELADPLQKLLASQRGLAETMGEYAFYVLLVLLAVALLRRFPYKHFLNLHRLLPLVYLVLVFHSVVLLKFSSWLSPLGLTMVVLMAVGSVSAVIALLRRIGAGQRRRATVEAVELHPDSQVLRVDLKLEPGWRGHRAGQFAFLRFDGHREGAHPYTIASAWQADDRLFFLIKQSGDYTRTLAERLRAGDSVELEGPYGRFDFSGQRQRQIWVAGGIGISPFIARLQALALQGGHAAVDLFWATRRIEAEPLRRLQEDAERAGVRLHLLLDGRDQPLTLQRIQASVPDWQQSEVWFCGPSGFGRAILNQLRAAGLGRERFHQELFEMR
ncbi:MAG: hypothetical protein RJA44_1890, partial [Pseudomonadota bacterium]